MEEIARRDRDYGELTERMRQLRSQISNLESQIARERSTRSLAWPKPEKRMPEKDVLGEFNVGMDEPWFVAVHQE